MITNSNNQIKFKISFVCVIYEHSIDLIENMLFSLAKVLQYSSYIEYDIILVINDDIRRNFNSIYTVFFENRIHILKQENNVGFCKGNNIGIDYIDNDFIILINPDIIFKDSLCIDWLLTTAKLYNSISGKLIGDNNWYTYASSFPTDKKYNPIELPFHFNQPTLNMPGNWKKFPYIDGSLMCFSKNIWKTINGFDEHIFPGYFGENCFCFKAYLNNFQIKNAYIDNLYEHRSSYKNNIVEWTKKSRQYFYENYALVYWDKFLSYLI